LLSVTADSNIYISAFGYPGKPRQLLDMADAGLIRLDVSDAIIDETVRVLRDKFGWSLEALTAAEEQLRRIGNHVTPTQTVDVIKEDPADNRVLECAQAAGSDYIVTGDKGVLRYGQFGKAKIVKVADFLDMGQERLR